LESEVPGQIKRVYRLLEEGNYREARSVSRDIAEKNRQVSLPGIDEELRVLFKRIKMKRDEGRLFQPHENR
jgi:hypothetical protein